MNNLISINPKVSVGIPTYNRSNTLKRTLESVLNQKYQNLEIIISDNASTDGTQELCRQFCNADNRIKYFRQPYNRGANANFVEALKHANGTYFMWIGDDDWIDNAYIYQCLKLLVEKPEYSLVCGIAKYYQNRNEFQWGEKLSLLQNLRYLRVLHYYTKVSRNGAFYGIMKKNDLDRLSLKNVMGGDWLIIAGIAFMGKVKTIESVSVHRWLGGSTGSYKAMTSRLGLTRFEKCYPHLAIACHAFEEISKQKSLFAELKKMPSYLFATAVFVLIISWRAAIPSIVRPVLLRLQKLNIHATSKRSWNLKT
jgi:glycosyltransferase domain-containing protein